MTGDSEAVGGSESSGVSLTESPGPTTTGRTLWDLIAALSWIVFSIVLIAAVVWWVYSVVGRMPWWIVIAALTSLAWLPFLQARAREDSRLFVVLDGPLRLTEYRIGKKVQTSIEGSPVVVSSRTGATRSVLTSFDPESLRGVGSPLAEFSQLEMLRRVETLEGATSALVDLIRSQRNTREMMQVGIEAQVRDLSESWMEIALATLAPVELEELVLDGEELKDIPAELEEMVEHD
jgi:hypothetical protein